MTGFGRAEYTNNNISASVEVKSVNNRYCDISVRLPSLIKQHERKIHEWVQQHITRGKINVSIHLDQRQEALIDIDIDSAKAKAYADLLKKLKNEGDIKSDITIQELMRFEDIFVSPEQDENTINEAIETSGQALELALQDLNDTRYQEGQELKADLSNRIDLIENKITDIKAAVKERIPEARDRLYERIQNLINDTEIDKDRIEQEIAIQADKIDVTEELVRLDSHIKFYREVLEQEGPIGQRLHFLLQEMNREINTIGSKANSADVSQQVVFVKETLEKIREQVQNIE